MLNDLYRRTIIDHNKRRRNYYELQGEDVIKVHYKNPTCGDVMTLYTRLENDRIKDISFLGEGCSISMASSSMMTELIKGKSLEEVANLRIHAEKLIRTGETADSDLGDWLSLEGVHKLRARHNCALMPWRAYDKMLKTLNRME
ncbi:Fe-S cluster assembly sulfur transfer protein SufU [Ectobacillus funiculus]|uniref:Fe-S cluster assembly sulfur transfer protein SufU n=1 Tax=Ectobacillus funiculus TaxID=137993 RepID=A0ABV5WHT8_9BACI